MIAIKPVGPDRAERLFAIAVTPDVYTTEERSRVMATVRNRGTKPELELRRSLWAAGVRGWRCNRRDLPGTPDLAFSRGKLAIFVDGAFWHGHPSKFRPGRSGAFWDEKIARNQARDREVEEELTALGWRVLRVWDFEVLKDPVAAVARVKALLS
ncbi:MAG: very short patch repair endonuclease [Solirubrobacteraceae bacterium]